MKSINLILLVCIISVKMYAQSPYSLDWRKEQVFLGVGASALGASYYMKTGVSKLNAYDIENLSSTNLIGLDRGSHDNYAKSAKTWSDAILYGSLAIPAALFLGDQMNDDAAKIAVMWGEVLLLNMGVTNTVKYSTQRLRPYVYNPNVPLEEKTTLKAKTSFFSGHTSSVAASTFFAAKVFSDYYPDSKWKPYIWGAAIALPAVTGYLRVKAGKHYPTDVMAGYAVGAAIGYLVPHFHKTSNRNNTFQVSAGANGVLLQYKF